MEVETLQMLTFALSVSHAVLIVQNYSIDPNILRLLQTCEMMKPSSSSSSPGSGLGSAGGSSSSAAAAARITVAGEDVQQFFPHVVFVHNRSSDNHFVPETLKEMQVSIFLLLFYNSIVILGLFCFVFFFLYKIC